MIRFVLKSAFFLGLVALVAPSLTGRSSEGDEPSAGIDVFSTLAGAQAAISDLSGFCERVPDACATGGDLARFAAERVGDGLQVVTGFIDSSSDSRSTLEKRFAGVDSRAGRTDPAIAAAGVKARAALAHDGMDDGMSRDGVPHDAMEIGAVTRALARDRPALAASARGHMEAVAQKGFAMPGVASVKLGDPSNPSPRASIPASRPASRLPIPSPAPRV